MQAYDQGISMPKSACAYLYEFGVTVQQACAHAAQTVGKCFKSAKILRPGLPGGCLARLAEDTGGKGLCGVTVIRLSSYD